MAAVAGPGGGDGNAIAPLPLHLIQRAVSGREQRVGIDAVFGRGRDADRDARRQSLVAVSHLEGMATHRRAQALSDLARALRRRVRQQRHELVPRITSRQVVRAQVLPQQLGDLHEHTISLQVTVGVIHQLEEIDVDDKQRHRLARGRRDLERSGELLDERATKRQLRQVVDANNDASERKGRRRPSVANRKSGGSGYLAGAGFRP
jgi:hypothetical protein